MGHQKKRERKKKRKKDQFHPLFINIASGFVTFLVLLILYKAVNGYQWLIDGIILSNVRIAYEHQDLTIEQKWALKCGFDYRFLNYIQQNTPEDAVILMPPDSALFPAGKKSDFNQRDASGVKNKAWSTYFLYPRILVYDGESATNPYYQKISHVAITNYWGYDRLNYTISRNQKYQVLPIQTGSK